MATTLEVKGGDMITAMNIFDVLDVVEEYMGCEVRQYIEEYLADNITDTEAMEKDMELTERAAQETVQRIRTVMANVLDKVDEVDMETHRTRIDRTAITTGLNAMRKMIRREL